MEYHINRMTRRQYWMARWADRFESDGARDRAAGDATPRVVVRSAILVFALLVIIIGVVGLISPDTLMALRREYVVNAYGMYVVAALRMALGVLLIRFAPASRAPKIVGVLGAMVCLQALVQVVAATFIDLDRARAILDWEASHPGLLRVGALIALTFGGFLGFAVTKTPYRRSS
jgi:hypothetical protein